MRTARLAAASAAILIAAALGACSRQEATQVKEGVQAAAGEIKEAAGDIKNDPDVKEAGTAIKEATKDAGTEIKEAAVEAGDAAKDATSDLRAGAKEAGAEARQAGREAGADLRKAGKEAKDEVDGNPKTS